VQIGHPLRFDPVEREEWIDAARAWVGAGPASHRTWRSQQLAI
jgi:hypothetical protein